MNFRDQAFIDGKFVPAQSLWRFDSINPATGAECNAADVELAIVCLWAQWCRGFFRWIWYRRKTPAALGVGNSVLLKPAQQSPLSALRFAELAAKVGVAVGVFNVVTGFGATARKALGLHMDVDFLYRINRNRQAAHAIFGAIDPEIGLARNER